MQIIATAKAKLQQKLQSFLNNEDCPPPFVFFLAFLITHAGIDLAPSYFGQLLFVFAIGVALYCNMNFLFTMAPFVGCNSQFAAIIMFTVCALACNEKWKALIFILAIGDSATIVPQTNAVFLSVYCSFLCVMAHQSLVFKTVQDNIQFFSGFFTVAVHYGLKWVYMHIEEERNAWSNLPLLLISLGIGYSVMWKKMQDLKKQNRQNIKHPRVLAHFLTLIETALKNQSTRKAKIMMHARNCRQVNCICQSPQIIDNEQYFIRQLYQDSINSFTQTNQPLLRQHYVQFLIQNNQMINALHFISEWRPTNYFMLISRLRMQTKIKHILVDQNSANMYEKEYIFALKYDEQCLYLAKEVNQILKIKISFWNEVGKENPSLCKMQTNGIKIVQKMYQLNQFYGNHIKLLEKTLYSFDATVIYGMYLLSTTNFTEYAETLIKNTSKLLEEVYVFQNSAAETFAIVTRVEDMKKSFIGSKGDCLTLLRNPNISETRLQNTEPCDFKLIIKAVSNGFCRLIKQSKTDLLGEQLNSIIPNGYKQVHNTRLNYLLDFQREQIREIVPSKIMHNELRLPIKGANGELLMGFICIKFEVDIDKGLTFVSVIKRVHDKSMNALIDFHGRITEKQQGFTDNILEHSQVMRYIEGIKSSWKQQKVIRQEKFNVMINTASFGVTIGSPLLALFLEKENLRDKYPPLHIAVINQQSNRFRTLQNDQNNKMAQQIKRMETAIVNYDTQSSAVSAKSTTSAISVLSVFSQNNSIPVYRCIQIVFLIVIVGCFTANLCFFMTAKLQWDPISYNNNPINDTINMYTTQLLTARTLLNLGDLLSYYMVYNYLNRTAVSSYFGNQNYQKSFVSIVKQYQILFRSNLYQCLNNTSDLLKQNIRQRFQANITVPNFYNATIMKTRPMINLTYLQLSCNYAVDFSIMDTTTYTNFWGQTIYTTFTDPVIKAMNVSQFIPIIVSSVEHSQSSSLIIGCTLSAVILILIVPLVFALKRRLRDHQRLFDLIVSVDSELIISEIKSLSYICNILKNYQDSNQILKTNVLGYQENQINPNKNRRNSADNNIVIGLEKYDINAASILFGKNIQKIGNEKRNSAMTRAPTPKKMKSSGQSNSSSIFSTIKQQFTNKNKVNSLKRKRAGQLQLQGSQLDPNLKIIPRHLIFVILIAAFLLLLSAGIVQNRIFNLQLKESSLSLVQQLTAEIVFDLTFLKIKMYLGGGKTLLKNIFGIKDELTFIQSAIDSAVVFKYGQTNNEEDIMAACYLNSSSINSKYIQKYCKYQYSATLLKAEFGSLFKHLVQLRYTADQQLNFFMANHMSYIYYDIITKIAQKNYYLQSLGNKLSELILAKTDLQFQQITETAIVHDQFKQMLLLMSMVWGVSCLVTGLAIIWRMKSEYLKQVYMITFLNNDMVLKNKRVESFLESLARTNYS